ncbi:ATP-binding cassette domain-containing protein [Candidatus Peregrinibacteria bacterium]|nr:ATP-binding cassette domain-containing protein [Candidatus Peregrinibacteria bacterium]
MIQFHNIHKKFGARLVLENIELTIEGGDFVSLIGHSGAGKTTLINLLIGAEKPDIGTIFVDDYDVAEMDSTTLQEYRQRLGVVYQDFRLLPRKTVYENVAFVLEVCGKSDDEIAERVPEALEMVGLLDHSRLFPHQLSGGELQKTSLARAIAHNPPLIIADEPTGNLDPASAREIIDILRKIHAQKKTILLASHNQELVNYIRQRVVMMNQGRIVCDEKESKYDVKLLRKFSEQIVVS